MNIKKTQRKKVVKKNDLSSLVPSAGLVNR